MKGEPKEKMCLQKGDRGGERETQYYIRHGPIEDIMGSYYC